METGIWVPSHVSEEDFLRKVGAEHAWRQQVNDLADKLCGEKAAKLARPEARAASQYHDHCSKKAQEVLASRAEKILTAVGENQRPVYKVFLQDKQARKNPEANARPCKKRVGSNIGRGHTTAQQEWFQELVRTKSIHAWEWEGLNLRCAQCQLKLLHTKNRRTLEALAAHQCVHQGRVAIEGVHVTHVLKLLGSRQLWVCEGCGGQLSLKTQTVSQKLAAACCFKKDSRCKSLFKPEAANPIRSLFQPAQAVRPVEGPNPSVRNGGNEAGGPALPPMKSEEEKPEGGASPEPKALHHPAGDDTQEGLPSPPAGEGQPPEVEAWENRRREVPPPSRQPGKAQGKGEYLLERRTPAQRFVAAQRVPPMPPPAKRAAHPGWGHEEWEGWQQWGTSTGPEGGPPAGGGPRETGTKPRAQESETSQEPAPDEEQDPRDQEPPADLNTGNRPANEGGNLILRASSRGRGNGLANQMPDRASYEVQGKTRFLTMLARGGSRVCTPLTGNPAGS